MEDQFISAIRGKFIGGTVQFSPPPEWTEGIEIHMEPVHERDSIGISEEEQGDDPESIARWIAWLNSLKPFRMTEEEEARWKAGLEAQKEYELSQFAAHAEKLRNMFP